MRWRWRWTPSGVQYYDRSQACWAHWSLIYDSGGGGMPLHYRRRAVWRWWRWLRDRLT